MAAEAVRPVVVEEERAVEAWEAEATASRRRQYMDLLLPHRSRDSHCRSVRKELWILLGHSALSCIQYPYESESVG